MLNKKLTALAVASAFSANAFAIDLDSSADQANIYASETLSAFPVTLIRNETPISEDLVFTAKVGFSITAGQSKYLRLDLNGAKFGSAVVGGVEATAGDFTDSAVGNTEYVVSQGGAVGDDFVIVEIKAPAGGIAPDDVITFKIAEDTYVPGPPAVTTVPAFTLDQAVATMSYSLYESAGDAVAMNSPLKATSAVAFTDVQSSTTGVISTQQDVVATAASGFKKFVDPDGVGAQTDQVVNVGSLKTSAYLTLGAINADGTALALPDVIPTALQIVTVTGDVSFGNWKLGTDANCATGPVNLVNDNVNGSAKTAAAIDVRAAELYVCVDNSVAVGDPVEIQPAEKGSYQVSIDVSDLSGSLGTISYDTVSINVPFVTLFSDYNQRIYLINDNNSSVSYTTSFQTEDGVVVTPGTKDKGELAKNSVTMIKASELVGSLSKGNRVAATIEVEAVEGTIRATTQIVSEGGTDTIILRETNKVTPQP